MYHLLHYFLQPLPNVSFSVPKTWKSLRVHGVCASVLRQVSSALKCRPYLTWLREDVADDPHKLESNSLIDVPLLKLQDKISSLKEEITQTSHVTNNLMQ